VILNEFRQGSNPEEVCRLLADPRRPSDAESWAAGATAELERREVACDVRAAGFIASTHARELLFFTMNHPTNRMLGFVAEQILRRIGIEGDLDHSGIGRRSWRRCRWGRLKHEVLGQTFFPLHANHARALRLELGSELVAGGARNEGGARDEGGARYRIGGRKLAPVDAIRAYFNYYEANPEIVRVNIDAHASVGAAQ
jgi:hypothetical protein